MNTSIFSVISLLTTTSTPFAAKRAEAGIALASNVSDHKIVDPALKSTTYQTTPKPLANMIIAGLLGLLLPAIGIVLKDSLNNRINARFVVEDYTSIPVLAHIEHYRSEKTSGPRIPKISTN